MSNQGNAWKKLEELANSHANRHIAEEFVSDASRFEKFSYQACDFLLDISKQSINEQVLETLLSLAKERDLKQWIEDLFAGKKVNNFEDRPALHMALRAQSDAEYLADGEDITGDVYQCLEKMQTLVERLREGTWLGYSGKPIDTVVNIGVGGSDLGPLMACHALEEFDSNQHPFAIHFASTMDGSQLAALLPKLNPETTVFAFSSKSFSTVDTLSNAHTAREWLINKGGKTAEEINQQHFVGVSCKPEKMTEWGIPEAHQLPIWDWVGGRYSMWSAIGFTIALKIGMDGFREMLSGAQELDTHFRNEPLENNLPTLLALMEIWNINFLGIHSRAVLPYDGRLQYLPAYLQQLEMESNGKNTDRESQPVSTHTCPIVWGTVGPNGQHAFYQLLHQGTERVMCDFIAIGSDSSDETLPSLKDQHNLTLANFLAQSRILALGDSVIENSQQQPGHKRYKGNQPCTSILLKSLSPKSFGALIALYEHKVFVQSVIWGINPFDQWGVELGKVVSTDLLRILENQQSEADLDSSTQGLLKAIKTLN